VGQGLYAKSNGEFGKVERVRGLDYYDGELQFIDLESFFQSVTYAGLGPARGFELDLYDGDFNRMGSASSGIFHLAKAIAKSMPLEFRFAAAMAALKFGA